MNKMLPRWVFEGDAYITHDHKIPRSKHTTKTNIFKCGIQKTAKFNTKIYLSNIDEVHKGSPLLWLWFYDQM